MKFQTRSGDNLCNRWRWFRFHVARAKKSSLCFLLGSEPEGADDLRYHTGRFWFSVSPFLRPPPPPQASLQTLWLASQALWLASRPSGWPPSPSGWPPDPLHGLQTLWLASKTLFQVSKTNTSGVLQKNEEWQRVSLMDKARTSPCLALWIGHRPLWGRCPVTTATTILRYFMALETADQITLEQLFYDESANIATGSETLRVLDMKFRNEIVVYNLISE